jgi:hypothetical protein
MSKHAQTPCKHCGAPVVFASVKQPDGTHRPVSMDPTTPVYHRIVDPEEGKAFWIQDEAPRGESRQSLARHRCGKGDC